MSNKHLFSIIAAFLFSCSSLWAQNVSFGNDIAVANTNHGRVRGLIQEGIYTYKGIPYAQSKRFEDPQPPANWEGIRSALVYGPVAHLMTPTAVANDESEFVFNHSWGYPGENNQVLNVWTPSITDGKKRPVMFWIHGGGFTAGSSEELPSYDGKNLSKNGDVVVVSINHRLNILGFLDLSAYGEKYKHSANQSLLDMQAALTWVKNNIENFGGDPDNVTIFGQSGGGAKVNALMAMPSAHGLFHKAINQSGAFRGASATTETTRAVTEEVLKNLGLDASTVDQIQTIPWEDLRIAGNKAIQTINERLTATGTDTGVFGYNWGPSVDGAVLPHDILDAESLELSKDIPLMIGTVKNEFFTTLWRGIPNNDQAKVDEFIAQQYKDKADAYKKAVKKAYPHLENPGDLVDVDLLFRPGAVHQANVKSSIKDGADVYMYFFEWSSPVFGGKYKSMHCFELPFVFDNVAECYGMTGGSNENTDAVAKQVSGAWINFARTGNPNHDQLIEWPTYDQKKTQTMFFNVKSHVGPQHDKELLKLVSSN